VGVPPFDLQLARPAWQVRCTDLVSRSFVQYVTELAALTADQQIKRDMRYVWQSGKYTIVMARSTGMELVTIRVQGLISHHSRQAASLRSQLISPRPVRVLIPPTLLHRLMLPDRHPYGRQPTLQLSNIFPNLLGLPLPLTWRHCCVKLFLTQIQILWLELFNWGHTVLHAPKRGGKRHNLTSAIKLRISTYSAVQPDREFANPVDKPRRQTSSTSTISHAVSAKLEDGNVRTAVRLLMSEDNPAAPSPDAVSALREKHPPSSSVLC